jgi:hypothetical protein
MISVPFSRSFVRKHRTVICRGIGPNIVVIPSKEEAIYPPFFEAYTKMCDIPQFFLKHIDATECIQQLPFPPFEDQMAIMKNLKELETMVPLQEIKPYLMYHMVHGEEEKASELLGTYQQYLSTIEHVQDLIQDILVSNLPL